ncbi:MAG: hypothetical protein ACOYXA_16985 [Bacteroidota bacterium]
MIPYKELREINAKLWILIWVNVAVITVLVVSAVVIIYFQKYWMFSLVVLAAILHGVVSYWLHVKMKKHIRSS